MQCPHCGGGVQAGEIVSQYQTQIRNHGWSGLSSAFMWDAAGTAPRVQGRHPRQTPMRSAAPRRNWGPDAALATQTQ